MIPIQEHRSTDYPVSCGTLSMRHRHDPNVVLVHYADLIADLGGEMRRLASCFGIEVPKDTWPILVEAATSRACGPPQTGWPRTRRIS